MDNRFLEVNQKIKNLRLHSDVSFLFMLLIRGIKLSDKKINTFLKMETKMATGFLYRLVISNAYKYGVPSIYIKNCISNKNQYKNSKNNKYYKNDDIQRYKRKMHNSYNDLLSATLELIAHKNSRKEKINSVLEKIADKKV